MATAPTQSTLDLNSGKTFSTTETSTNGPGAESAFGRSPSTEPPILPATIYKAPTHFKSSPLKRSLSLDSPKEPEIIITRLDIQPSIKGSDHCPIYVDLHEEIEVDGQKLNLREQMFGSDPQKQPPRIATRYWDEYSGKQTMLSSFFGKKGAQPPATQKSDATAKTPSILTLDLDPEIEEVPPPSSSQVTRVSSPPPESDSQPTRPLKRKESPSYSVSQTYRSSSFTATKPTKKQKVVTKPGQAKLSSFFAAPPNKPENKSKPPQPPSEIIDLDLGDPSLTPTQQSSALSQSDDAEQLENDYQLARSLASSSQTTQTSLSNQSGSSSQSKSSKSTTASWSMIMAPLVAPLCTVHMEPTKELTVNKPGPNKGKKFYVCSRFVIV